MKQIRILYVLMTAAAVFGCTNLSTLESDLDNLENRIESLEESSSAINSNTLALKTIIDGALVIVGYTETVSDDGKVTGYCLEMSDGTKMDVLFGKNILGNAPVVSINSERLWTISTDGGESFSVIGTGVTADGTTPLVMVDANGYWCVSMDGGSSYTRITNPAGEPISAVNGAINTGTASVFEKISYNEAEGTFSFTVLETRETITVPVYENFYLSVIGLDDKKDVILLSETRVYEVEMSGVADAWIQVPTGWNAVLEDNLFTVIGPESGTAGDYTVTVVIFSEEKYARKYSYTFTLNPTALEANACTEWKEFVTGSETNVLADFSYAGYMRGESAPADVMSLGYTVYDVTDYGAVPNDGQSDREAFLKAVSAALGTDYEQLTDNDITFKPNANARAIVYFPEGEYILHTAEDDILNGTVTQTIRIRAGQFILKGAGRDKTTLVMEAPAQPRNENLYSSPAMIEIKHNTGFADLTDVTSDAEAGTFSVNVASTVGIAPGTWVCLYLLNNSTDLVAEEFSPHEANSGMTDIINTGVNVIDIHQVKSVEGNTVTFYEPILRKVEAAYGWKIRSYSHYEEVGVEDLTFKGNAKDDFSHHASWQDDGAYKPINLMRCANSWMRRVGFESVSECCSFIDCANISAYDIVITGNRGHSAIRADESSRVLIAAVTDKSSGNLCGSGPIVSGTWTENAGQYHGSGVQGASIGTVLWRNTYGDDSCFESHGSQPRQTLIDCCSGGFMRSRMGGSLETLPNHLKGLVLWNMYATTANKAGTDDSFLSNWTWYTNSNDYSFKVIMPVIVGFQSAFSVTFNPDTCERISSQGTPVFPESLYEAQLRQRLGYVPAWLNSLK